MKINTKRCLKLGLPEPGRLQKQHNYVLMCITGGITLNTRICRYINIYNLHSIASTIFNDMKIDITRKSRIPVICPESGVLDSVGVLVVYMTPEQIQAYKDKKPDSGK